jgi:hypothetical protein
MVMYLEDLEKGRHDFLAKYFLLVDLEGSAARQPRNDRRRSPACSFYVFMKLTGELKLPGKLHALTIILLIRGSRRRYCCLS